MDRSERICRRVAYRRPRRGDRLVWNRRTVEVAAVPLQPEIIDPDATDQREHWSELDTVFDRSGESVEVAGSNIGFHSAVDTGSRIEHGNGSRAKVKRVILRIAFLGERDVAAAHL